MSEKYIELKPQIVSDYALVRATAVQGGVGIALEWLDRHPDQVPGRTITESKFKHAARKNQIGDSFGCYEGFLDDIGIKVIPDPEPTNAEKLEATLLDTFGLLETLGNQGVHNLAFNLDKAGVKAKTNQEES